MTEIQSGQDLISALNKTNLPRLIVVICRQWFFIYFLVDSFGKSYFIHVLINTLMMQEPDLSMICVIALPDLFHVFLCWLQHIAQLQQYSLALLVQLVYLQLFLAYLIVQIAHLLFCLCLMMFEVIWTIVTIFLEVIINFGKFSELLYHSILFSFFFVDSGQ